MVSPVLVDPERREDPRYQGEVEQGLPRILQKMDEAQKAQLFYLVEKKAWIKATMIQDFTDEEQGKIAKAQKERGPKFAKKVSDRLYLRYHWDSLRWFLFGGLVDIPIQQDATRAWDPIDNPFLKVRVPGFVWTQDEHDQASPYKRLPDKDYLRILSYAWVHQPLLAVPKSRQMMVTWLFSAIAVHETLFRQAKNTAWISKKFDDANATVEKRVKPVMERIPSRLWRPEHHFKSGLLECGDSGSLIRAMGEEAKGLRQYTFSWVFSDEAAFQDQASDIIQAALPAVKGGGRLTLVSSANGKETFHNVVSESGRIAVPAGN
jgi:hypothetical protein